MCQPVSVFDSRQTLSFANQAKTELTKILQSLELLPTVCWVSFLPALKTEMKIKEHIFKEAFLLH